MASVAEVKAAIDAAMQQVSDGQVAINAAKEKFGESQQSLAAAVEGSGHEAVGAAQAAGALVMERLDEALQASLGMVEQAQTYVTTL